MIIHPPPYNKTIIDKTASFVAENGPRSEIFNASNAGNPIFNFLNGSDPYHAYYQHRLSVFRAQNDQALQQAQSSADRWQAMQLRSLIRNEKLIATGFYNNTFNLHEV
ncbi:putative SWAP/Surp superfamily protein [Helianthus annuus]|nr:putative SWAP/Surp superfamily protein [Helianthus annuus]